ncbi:opioid growth factor receptor-like protein 1 [Callorhinchus milii]|uniref:opioid growth factor receptor-like protein 1 n=1 Tax=Callorhinchus milii TaxID=7868 RepID=UPI001C3FC1D3|nr:opioid growth factor receptor-like protein 1 [Callorhinchus milii]
MGNMLVWSRKEPGSLEECDSTWGSETEEERTAEDADLEEPCSKHDQNEDKTETPIKPKRSFYAARDLYMYRHGYPRSSKKKPMYTNLHFYMNKITLKPDGIFISEILTEWKGDYDKLEHKHTYIQWLFPLREPGLNWHAEELTAEEIKEFLSTEMATSNYLQVYEIMLDFFGIKLEDRITGKVTRAENWKERFQHLNGSRHNYLRITRILKSLGEFKYEKFQFNLVHLLLREVLVERTLANMAHSALEYFVFTIKKRSDRRRLLRFAQRHYRPPENFIWGPPAKPVIKAPSSPSKRQTSQQERAPSHTAPGAGEGPAGEAHADTAVAMATAPTVEGPSKPPAGHADSETTGKGEGIVSKDGDRSTEGEAEEKEEVEKKEEKENCILYVSSTELIGDAARSGLQNTPGLPLASNVLFDQAALSGKDLTGKVPPESTSAWLSDSALTSE